MRTSVTWHTFLYNKGIRAYRRGLLDSQMQAFEFFLGDIISLMGDSWANN